MNVERAQLPATKELAPKLLGETDCWILLSEGRAAVPAKDGQSAKPAEEAVRVRVDYLTAAQDSEFHRRGIRFETWGTGEHPEDYYLRATIKEIVGLTYEGQPFRLTFDQQGLVEEVGEAGSGEEIKPDLISMLKAVNLYDIARVKMRMKLSLTEADKKKQPTLPSSTEPQERSASALSSPEPRLQTDGPASTPAPAG